jgi:radical SAM superfamily enzyme YgiQ (UPF0313 family)
MRLLLVNPTNPLVSSVQRRRSRWNQWRVWKPLGLLVIAGVTPKGWDVTVADENVRPVDYNDIPRPDLVGITAFSSQAAHAYKLADSLRERGIPVIMGGIHASMRPDEATEHVDAVVKGEAEEVWPTVLGDFEQGRLQRLYDGTNADICGVPAPRHDLLNGDYKFGSVQTTRGCPLNCSFCSVTAFNGRQFRLRPIDDIIEELKSIHEKRVLFVDDNFVGTRREHIVRAKELFRAMIKAKLKKRWMGQVTINLADDDELLQLASKAGCFGIYVGFESPTDEGLAEVNKKFNTKNRDLRAAVRKIHRHRISVVASFVLGLDVDRPGIGKKIARAALDYGVVALNVMFLTPLPGTRLWDDMENDDRIAANNFPHDWRYYTLTYPILKHPHLTTEDMLGEVRACYRTFYSYHRILYRSLLSFIHRRRPITTFLTNLVLRRDGKPCMEE